jgi:hypothetical protein
MMAAVGARSLEWPYLLSGLRLVLTLVSLLLRLVPPTSCGRHRPNAAALTTVVITPAWQ